MDILHPLVSLRWEKCKNLRLGTNYAQAVWIEETGKLYVGAMLTTGTRRDHARLYIYDPAKDTWDEMDTPVYYFAMTKYENDLVIVNGRRYIDTEHSGPLTDEVLSFNSQWQPVQGVPAMNTKRCATSAVSHGQYLVVAGGYINIGMCDLVEVFNGQQWMFVSSLPGCGVEMKSVVLEDKWYLVGGREQGSNVYFATFESLKHESHYGSTSGNVSTWKKLPQLLYERSSPAVFGQRLITVGGINKWPGQPISTTTISAYCPKTESWIYVGDLPQRLHSSCVVVLPTGELIVIGGMDGFTSRLKVVNKLTLCGVPYDSRSEFTMVSLTKLEQGPKTIPILTIFKEKPVEFVRASGVVYNALMTKRFKSESGLDVSTFDVECWIRGESHFSPTWTNLLMILRNMGYKKYAKQIEGYLRQNNSQLQESGDKPGMFRKLYAKAVVKRAIIDTIITTLQLKEYDVRYASAVRSAMKHGSIKHTILQGVFVGPARSGKNCLMERLLQRIPPRESASTGVADSVIKVTYKCKHNSVTSVVAWANIDGTDWAEMDEHDQAVEFLRISRNNCTESHPTTVPETQCVAEDDTSVTHSQTRSPQTSDCCRGPVSLVNNILEIQPSVSYKSNSFQKECHDPVSVFKQAIRKKGLESLELHTNRASLYLNNTGGQVEFQEVLPVLVSGSSVFFYTFRLDCDLDKPYEVVFELHEKTKNVTYTYKSSVTIMEGILQTLASIASMNSGHSDETKPKVFFVGTHKDQLQLKNRAAIVKSIDDKLKNAIKPLAELDIVEHASENQLIFALNNFSESDSEYDAIRSRVHEIMDRGEYEMEFPKHWLAYSFALKNIDPQITTLDHCFEIAKEFGISTKEELKEALRFLHAATGLIRYFPFSDMEDIVVIHPQFLFNVVTELIVATFTFDKINKSKVEKFKESGIFSLKDMEKTAAKHFRVHSQGRVTPKQFGKVLEKLRIAAPFKEKGEEMYFLPCVLCHANVQEDITSPSDMPSLFVSFEHGYCPKGVAGALISYLMEDEMKSLNFAWELLKDKIFRDQVTFSVGPYDTVIIKSFATHLKITCIPGEFEYRKCTTTETCGKVYEALESGLQQVLKDMNYGKVKYSFTFKCSKCTTEHPAKMNHYDNLPSSLTCPKTGEKFDLPPGSDKWGLGNTAQVVTSFCSQLQECFSKWYQIGVQLEISTGVLDNIEYADQVSDVSKKFKTMLEKWFTTVTSRDSITNNQNKLEELKRALRSKAIGENTAAKNLCLP